MPVAGVPPNQTTSHSALPQPHYHIFGYSVRDIIGGLFKQCNPTPHLLLDSSDFPGVHVTEIIQEDGTTNDDEPAVQVKIRVPDFTVLESLVLFETRDLALGILASIKQDQTAQGVVSVPIEGFQDMQGSWVII